MKIKLYLLLLLLSLTSYVFSQNTIYGRVVDEDNNPIIGAAIYLNNTSNWTTSDEKGEFEITVFNSNYNLIVTYLGYQSLLHKITSNSYNKRLIFIMTEKINKLNEVVLKANKVSKIKYGRYMLEFKSAFLGTSEFARNCTILNKEVLSFSFDKNTGVLKATAKEPLKIRNNSLGYSITYDLTLFEKSSESVKYLGYSRFEELKSSSKRSIKKWKRNRKKAYKGSLMHFLQALLKNDYRDQGFRVNHYKLVKNPERPSDSILMTSAAFLERLVAPNGETTQLQGSDYNLDSLNKGKRKYFAKDWMDYHRKKDSLLTIVKKASLYRTKNVLLKNVPKEEFTFERDSLLYLKINQYITVRYLREDEDESYPGRNPTRYGQTSIIRLKVDSTPIDSFGNIIDPLAMIVYEYMAYEKFGDSLPLNYQIEDF